MSVVQLQCFLTNDPTSPSPTPPLLFQPEEGKKSSFRCDAPADYTIDSPSHLVIQCHGMPFLFGGFEMSSNARSIEAYATNEEGKTNYLRTVRGVQTKYFENAVVDNDDSKDELYKSVLVCPSGPQTMIQLHLKLLSLQPPTTTRAFLKYITLKGRLPQVTTDETVDASTTSASPVVPGTAAIPANPTTATTAKPTLTNATTNPTGQPLPGVITQADMGAAMAGMSILVRSVEARVVEQLEDSLSKVEIQLSQKLQTLFGQQYQYQQQLFPVLLSQQQALLQQQGLLLQQQQSELKQQREMLLQLQQQQHQLLLEVHTWKLSSTMESPRLVEESGNTKTEDEVVVLNLKTTPIQEPTDVTQQVIPEDDKEHDDECPGPIDHDTILAACPSNVVEVAAAAMQWNQDEEPEKSVHHDGDGECLNAEPLKSTEKCNDPVSESNADELPDPEFEHVEEQKSSHAMENTDGDDPIESLDDASLVEKQEAFINPIATVEEEEEPASDGDINEAGVASRKQMNDSTKSFIIMETRDNPFEIPDLMADDSFETIGTAVTVAATTATSAQVASENVVRIQN